MKSSKAPSKFRRTRSGQIRVPDLRARMRAVLPPSPAPRTARGRGRNRGAPISISPRVLLNNTPLINPRRRLMNFPTSRMIPLPTDEPEIGNEAEPRQPEEGRPEDAGPVAPPSRRQGSAGPWRRSDRATSGPRPPPALTHQPVREPEPRAREAEDAHQTGSAVVISFMMTDRPQPVSRPRSHRDLDSIPDDYD